MKHSLNYHYDPEALIIAFNLVGKNGRKPKLDGEELIACCPFKHRKKDGSLQYERNPSFAINVYTGKSNCFSCGQKAKNISHLAWKLAIEEPIIPKVAAKPYQKETAQRAADEVTDSYLKFLVRNQNKAEEYFLSRGLDLGDVILRYQIGASEKGDSIYLPVLDADGHLKGWGERNKYKQPKWRHEPDGFKKSNHLYGIHQAAGKDKVIVVESFVDVLNLASMGYTAVSTFGASVSAMQIELLLEHFNQFLLLPHNDDAGVKWAEILIDGLLERSRVFISLLPQEFDDIGEITQKEIVAGIIKRKKLVTRPLKKR